MEPTRVTDPVLDDELLERFGERAAVYDRENRFFAEDFADLRASGYLLLAVPRAFGGFGMNLAQVARQQRRLAYRAPATALATNMHLYWTGLAADLERSGDASVRWMLDAAARGDVFAAGHGEAGNDVPVLLSTTKAEPVDGGYRFYGRKMFGSLSPVWTYLGLHGLDTSDPDNPKVVHAFLPRTSAGYRIEETWDTLGMRATASQDTILEGAFVPDRLVARVVPAGFAGADLFVLGMFAWAQTTFASIYLAIAERARDLAVAGLQKRTSIGLSGRSMAAHPLLQHTVAAMDIELDGLRAHVERTAEDWASGVEHGAAWPAKLVATKYRAVEGAKRVVDLALDVSGGGGMFKRSELEQLYRDVRAGGFHPANAAFVHEVVGKTALGLLGTEPRWG
jgi:alkylation response protein AidB-like acyl-CoA dehydrogenase